MEQKLVETTLVRVGGRSFSLVIKGASTNSSHTVGSHGVIMALSNFDFSMSLQNTVKIIQS